jgi:hypothetical protein
MSAGGWGSVVGGGVVPVGGGGVCVGGMVVGGCGSVVGGGVVPVGGGVVGGGVVPVVGSVGSVVAAVVVVVSVGASLVVCAAGAVVVTGCVEVALMSPGPVLVGAITVGSCWVCSRPVVGVFELTSTVDAVGSAGAGLLAVVVVAALADFGVEACLVVADALPVAFVTLADLASDAADALASRLGCWLERRSAWAVIGVNAACWAGEAAGSTAAIADRWWWTRVVE